MKERLITFALAIGALAFFYALFMPGSAPADLITTPKSTERGPNGYAGMVQWLSKESIPNISFRERFNRLAETAPGKGNLLITTMPHSLAARPSELEQLHDWIKAGNTVLVMAALSDTPDWTMQPKYYGQLLAQLNDLTGIEFVVVPPERDDNKVGPKPEPPPGVQRMLDKVVALLEPERRVLAPIGDHPLLEGVATVAGLSEFPSSDWLAKPHAVSVVLDLAKREPTNAPALWLAQFGAGQWIVCGFGSSFTNKLLDQADNARFLSNVVRWSVRAGGKVVVDDAHQGAVAFYDPAAFFGDARLHRALWWLLLLWLVFVLGPARLRPTGANWDPVDITSLVRATGGFLARTVRPLEAASRELALFFNSIRRRLGLPEDGAPVWEWLGAQPNLRHEEVVQLRTFHARVVAGQRVDLQQLHNLLRQIALRLTGTTT